MATEKATAKEKAHAAKQTIVDLGTGVLHVMASDRSSLTDEERLLSKYYSNIALGMMAALVCCAAAGIFLSLWEPLLIAIPLVLLGIGYMMRCQYNYVTGRYTFLLVSCTERETEKRYLGEKDTTPTKYTFANEDKTILYQLTRTKRNGFIVGAYYLMAFKLDEYSEIGNQSLLYFIQV